MNNLIKLIVSIIAGLGIIWGSDKVLPTKVAGYQPIAPFSSPIKILITVGSIVAGFFAVTFLNKKLKIFKTR